MPAEHELPTVTGTIRPVDEKGRINFPKELLAEAGIEPGDRVSMIVWQGAVVIRPMMT